MTNAERVRTAEGLREQAKTLRALGQEGAAKSLEVQAQQIMRPGVVETQKERIAAEAAAEAEEEEEEASEEDLGVH